MPACRMRWELLGGWVGVLDGEGVFGLALEAGDEPAEEERCG